VTDRFADVDLADPDALDAVAARLAAVRAGPPLSRDEAEALRAEVDGLIARLRPALASVEEELAGTVTARRGLAGFGHLRPSVRGQRLDRRL
jgi:hypothetical protein